MNSTNENNLFDEIIDWWCSENSLHKTSSLNETKIVDALKSLGIQKENETLISKEIITDWYQNSEDTYLTIGKIALESQSTIRTLNIAGYAVVTPPGISLEDRIEIWESRSKELRGAGINIPEWYLVWNNTIYTYYPHLSLIDFLSKDLNDYILVDFAKELKDILVKLISLNIAPLNLPYAFRTNSLQVFYCGMGFDIGNILDSDSVPFLGDFEKELLPHFSDKFQEIYSNIK